MNDMYSKADFNIDDQVSFVYDSGSRPGTIRVVDVSSVTDTYIIGYDHYKDDDRTFSYKNIRSNTLKHIYSKPKKTITGVIEQGIDSICFDIYNDNSILFVIGCRNNKDVTINGNAIETIDDLKKMIKEITTKIGG